MEFEKIREIIAEKFGFDTEAITLDSSFKKDLGLDSLDLMELVMEMESIVNKTIKEDDLANIETVRDAMEAIRKVAD